MTKFLTLCTTISHITFHPAIVSSLLTLVVVGCTGTTPSSGTSTTISSGTSTVMSNVPGTTTSTGTGTPPRATLPHFDHIVIAIEENHAYSQIIGSGDAPYINSLATQGALFTDSHAIQHPSEPNYLSLFAGSTFGVNDDSCPLHVSNPDLGGELIAKSDSFAGYAESMPGVGFARCFSDDRLYARKHNPWVNFSDVPATDNQPFTNFPADFTNLPTVSFVVPNLENDMHDGSVSTGDTWLKDHLDSYIQWAQTHNSLFILTWDEDDNTTTNHIATIFAGDHVKAGQYSETINHYNILSTVEDIYGLAYLHNTSQGMAITGVWQ